MTEPLEVLITEVLDSDQLIPGLFRDADELIQLHVDRGRIPVQRVLDEEDHEEGEDRGGRIDDELPSIGEMEDGPGEGPAERHQDGDPKREAVTHPSGGQGGEPIECGLPVLAFVIWDLAQLVGHLVSRVSLGSSASCTRAPAWGNEARAPSPCSLVPNRVHPEGVEGSPTG